MGRAIVITSGKGGVGKTTTTANLGSALALMGKKVIMLDLDIGLRNLDVVLGLDNRIIYDIVDVAKGRCKLHQAIIKDKRFEDKLFLLPAAQNTDKSAIEPEEVKAIVADLKSDFDYILLDCPAGIEQGFANSVAGADEAIVVSTPEISAVRDADRVVGLLEQADLDEPPMLIINRIKKRMVNDGTMMDVDEIRKYERLTSIKDRFIAYPPFWYHYGSTANHIARNMDLPLSSDARKVYSDEALNCFEQFWSSNKYPLLREDLIASACALEEIDLLDIQEDKDKISGLLKEAIRFSGESNDILELCAMAYLRLGMLEEAGDILRVLVNEEYNKTVNAQLLSAIYVNMITKNKSEYEAKYELLATRVNPDYLFKIPKDYSEFAELEKEFKTRQEESNIMTL